MPCLRCGCENYLHSVKSDDVVGTTFPCQLCKCAGYLSSKNLPGYLREIGDDFQDFCQSAEALIEARRTQASRAGTQVRVNQRTNAGSDLAPPQVRIKNSI